VEVIPANSSWSISDTDPVLCAQEDSAVLCAHEDSAVLCAHEDSAVLCAHEDSAILCAHDDAAVLCAHEDTAVLCLRDSLDCKDCMRTLIYLHVCRVHTSVPQRSESMLCVATAQNAVRGSRC